MKKLVVIFLAFSLSFPLLAARYRMPKNYQKLEGCEKQKLLWNHIEKTKHDKLPGFSGMGVLKLLAMSVQAMRKKKNYNEDVAPKGWKKYLHRRGSVAKVKIVPAPGHTFTGAFQGVNCAPRSSKSYLQAY